MFSNEDRIVLIRLGTADEVSIGVGVIVPIFVDFLEAGTSIGTKVEKIDAVNCTVPVVNTVPGDGIVTAKEHFRMVVLAVIVHNLVPFPVDMVLKIVQKTFEEPFN